MNIPAYIEVLFLMVIPTALNECIPNKRLSGRLHGDVYRTLQTIGEYQCGYQCMVTQKCMSINYKRQSLTCELNTASDMTSLTGPLTWSYLEKSDIVDIPSSDPCTNWTCPPNAMCVSLSSGEVTCVIIACEIAPNVSNAEISVYNVGVAEQTTYTCNTHYQMEGIGSITCKADGTFTVTNFSCELIPCSDPPPVTNAVLGTYQTSVGGEALYTCTSGYMVDNGPAQIVCLLGGQWSSVGFSCIEIPCQAAPVVPNAVQGSYQISVGSEAPYSCQTGYSVTNGPAKVTCELGGEWSTATFSCDEIPCPNPPSVTNAVLGTYQNTMGSEAPYSCQTGYSVTNGPAKVTCELGGEWSTVTFSCDEIPCPNPPSVTNAVLGTYQNTVGSEAPYSCQTGYSVTNGPAKVTCELGGEWSTVTFSCDEIPCQAPPTVPNAIIGSYQKCVGCDAFYTCSPGYVVTNGPAKVTCIFGGQWSAVNFYCDIIGSGCPTPPSIDNTILMSPCQSPGCYATYDCKPGYIPSKAPPLQIQCQSTGIWGVANFFCILDPLGGTL